MKNNLKKRIVSLALAVAMMISLVPSTALTAFAEEINTTEIVVENVESVTEESSDATEEQQNDTVATEEQQTDTVAAEEQQTDAVTEEEQQTEPVTVDEEQETELKQEITVETEAVSEKAYNSVKEKTGLDTSGLEFDVASPAGHVTISFTDNGVRPENAVIKDAELYGTPLGIIIDKVSVPFETGDNVADVTVRLLDAMGIKHKCTGTVDDGFYLSALKEFEFNSKYYPTLGEFDAGSQSGWCVRLNNWHINQGASAFEVEDGDTVTWLYTCQYGADVGADFSNKSAEITGIVFAENYGTLAPEFGKDVKEYKYTVAENINSIAMEIKLDNYASVVTVKVDGNQVKYRPNKAIAVTSSSLVEISTALEYMDAANNNQITVYTDNVKIQLAPPNKAPSVVTGAPASIYATAGEEINVDLSGLFTDPDGDTLTYTVKIPALNFEQTVEGNVFKGTIPAAGKYEAVITATDGELDATHNVVIDVAEKVNTAPVVVADAATEISTKVNKEVSVDLSRFFEDADGDTLTYSVKIEKLNIDKAVEGNVFADTISEAGEYTVVVTASDGEAEATHTVTLTVKENTAPNIKAEFAESKSKTYVYSSSYVYIYMEDIFEDADGDTLTYSATLNGEKVEITYNDWTKEHYIMFNQKPVICEYKITANDGVADSEVFTAKCIGTSATITSAEGVSLPKGGSNLYYICGSEENDTFKMEYKLDVDTDIVPSWMVSNKNIITHNGDGEFTVTKPASRQSMYFGVTYGKDDWGSDVYLGTQYIYIIPELPEFGDVSVVLPEHADNVVAANVNNAVSGGLYTNEFDYTMEDPSIAEIAINGSYGLKVTPKALGTTKVTATFKYDPSVKAEFEITVTGRSLHIKDQPDTDSVGFAAGKTVQMTVKGAQEGETFTWTSADENVATVDQNGLVTIKALGQTYITATSSLSTDTVPVKASMYLQVKQAGKVYLEDIGFTDYTYFENMISAKSAFNSAQLEYNLYLQSSRYTYNKLAFTPYFDSENLNAVLNYQVSGGEYQQMTLENGKAVSITNGLNPGDNVVTVEVSPKDNAENVTKYTLNIFRPYNPTKTISSMTMYPNGDTALNYPTYDGYKEGTIFRWNESTNAYVEGWGGRPSTGWSSSHYSYKTYIFTPRSQTLSIYPNFGYVNERVQIWVDGEYVEEAVTNWKSSVLDIKDEGSVIEFKVVSEKYYAEQTALGNDPFETPENTYKIYVDVVKPLGIEAQIISAELSNGEFYKPGFSSKSYTVNALLPSDATNTELTFTVADGIDVYKGSATAANKLEPTGKDENGNNIYKTETTKITGTGMNAYSKTNIILQVTDEATGNVGMSQYEFTTSKRGDKDIYPDSIVEYLCIGSQYTNASNYGTMPERTLKSNGGTLSLGNFGGYITYKYDKPIENSPNNPYGVDFVIYGNSFGNGAHEPGYVQVSKDGETWYTLAGSEHFDDHNDWGYSMTYSNAGGKSAWTNSDGESGQIYSYPNAAAYPYYTWTEQNKQSITAEGFRLNSSAKDAYGSAAAVLPVFGYVDVNTNGSITGQTNNPYNHPGKLVDGGDMFDLAWAVDDNGTPVEIDRISYIRIATASSIYAGAIGEKSTEVTAVLRATNTAQEAVGKTEAAKITVNGKKLIATDKENVFAAMYENDEFVVEVNASEDANIYINNTSGASRTYTSAPESSIIRVIVQESEKEPYIAYITLLDDEATAKINAVEEKIEAIGTVTENSAQAVKTARDAYNALEELYKNFVENYSKLVNAETTLSALKVYKATGNYLEKLIKDNAPTVNTTGGEWLVLGLARSGKTVPIQYYANVINYVNENIDEEGQLHWFKSTDNSRVIIGLTSAGYDATNVAGNDLTKALKDIDYVKQQGVNGPVWALIATDSHNNVNLGNADRKAFVNEILKQQLADGGWTVMEGGTTTETDITAMAVQALAPYYSTDAKVKAAVEKALDKLSAMQLADGGYALGGSANSESTAQVIVALTAMGIDPLTDTRFVKDGNTTVKALTKYYVDGEGFSHNKDGKTDGMSTEQAYYALNAWVRFENGSNSLYDMSDVTVKTAVESTEELIDQIGTVTTDSSSIIKAAQLAYNALSEAEKASVSNADKIAQAEEQLKDIEKAAETEKLINDIGEVKPENYSKIEKARKAYDKLTAEQKKLVGNYNKLLDAEDEAVDQVENLIGKIGDVDLDSADAIAATKKAYNYLPEYLQKKVDNYDDLKAAEKELEKLREEALALLAEGKLVLTKTELLELKEDFEKVTENTGYDAVLALLRTFYKLGETQQLALENSDAVKLAQSIVAEYNHTNAFTGVKADGLEWNIRLVIKDAEDETTLNSIKAKLENSDILTIWDIYLEDVLTGKKYKPEEAVQLKIPSNLLGDYTAYDYLKVIHYTDDGRIELLNCEIADGYIVFNAAEFSWYGVVGFMNGEEETASDNLTADAPLLISPQPEVQQNNSNPVVWIVIAAAGIAALAVLVVLKKRTADEE